MSQRRQRVEALGRPQGSKRHGPVNSLVAAIAAEPAASPGRYPKNHVAPHLPTATQLQQGFRARETVISRSNNSAGRTVEMGQSRHFGGIYAMSASTRKRPNCCVSLSDATGYVDRLSACLR